ncbi:MAG: ABC transporter ATP-binding protein [Chloroflexi bacterium]|nr:ABC transporter ATP-binding protein [Chloroflexota bacterium]
MSEPMVQVSHLGVAFPTDEGGTLEVLRDVSFEVAPQAFLAVVGPSGCGKSTLLRVLAGLLQPSRGEVSFPAHQGSRPKVGLVFQKANLMPWRTVLRNITLPLELKGVPTEEAVRRAREMIARIGLEGFEDTLPRDLSGGMAQRVALARALIHEPDLLLLDEPFAALDALTRERLWDELLHIWRQERKTVVMVTHSVTEALLLADRVLVLSARPATVRLDMQVDLPRPRASDLRYTPHFGQLARRLREALGAVA